MSIYIPGMEFPKSCPCELVGIGYDLYCSFTGGNPSRVEEYYECCNNDSRPDWCPLVEVPPHGALKDADALWEKVKSERALKEHCPKSRSIIYDTGFLAGYRAACQIASKMPTIIPADAEEADNE